MYNTPPKGYNYTFLNSYSPYHNQVFLAPIRLAYEPLALASYTLPPFPPPLSRSFCHLGSRRFRLGEQERRKRKYGLACMNWWGTHEGPAELRERPRGDDHFQGFVPHNGISAAMDPVGGR